jgi:hypothetical protein
MNDEAQVQFGDADDDDSELMFSIDQEDDGRWICDVASVPGAMAYGVNPYEAIAKAFAIAASVIADAEKQASEVN